MTDDSQEPVTKGDLKQLEVKLSSRMDGMGSRFDRMDSHMDSLESRMDSVKTELMSYMESIKDQIIRGFQLTEESIRKDCAHVDQIADLNTHLSHVEQQLIIRD